MTLDNLMVKLKGMLNISSLPLLPGPLKQEVAAPDRFLSTAQIELFDIITVYLG